MTRLQRIAGGLALCLFAVSAMIGNAQASQYAIEVSMAGSCGAGAESWTAIAGSTSGADPRRHAVVLYSVTDRAYVQPFVAQPYAGIDPDGGWRAQIHRGAIYWALLVEIDRFDPPALTSAMPAGADVLASTTSVCRD